MPEPGPPQLSMISQLSQAFPPLILISNPKSGDGKGPSFVQTHVLRTLKENSVPVNEFVVTNGPGNAGEEALKFLEGHQESEEIAIVVSGGDGTVHEIVNALCSVAHRLLRPQRVLFAIIPTGTANALYSSSFPAASVEQTETNYKLQSLVALLSGRQGLRRLSIIKTQTKNQHGQDEATIYSAVVTSTSLHASILHDSEALRSQIPDMSRFKVAAMKNITRWYHSKITLKSTEDGNIWLYDHRAKRFAPELATDGQKSLDGPFAYFLSTVNVDRLEPAFVITPLYNLLPSEVDAMDILIIRPKQDPDEHDDTEEVRQRFAEKMGQMFSSAYNNGVHIGLFYGQDGKLTEDSQTAPAFVEYVRCGGWEWMPVREVQNYLEVYLSYLRRMLRM